MKGAYVLLLRGDSDRVVSIGRRGDILFKRGCHVYVGSAMNSLESRVARHIRTEKKKRWHIDYLREYSRITAYWLIESDERLECDIARAMAHRLDVVEGFGASDCGCCGHLFYRRGERATRSAVRSVIKELAGEHVFRCRPVKVDA